MTADRNCYYTVLAGDTGFKVKKIIIYSDLDTDTRNGFTVPYEVIFESGVYIEIMCRERDGRIYKNLTAGSVPVCFRLRWLLYKIASSGQTENNFNKLTESMVRESRDKQPCLTPCIIYHQPHVSVRLSAKLAFEL
ncbi:hypothetical protein QHH40_004473 [Salmonella enterica]|nr:hypothetical protein [Salmonella enterica]ELL3053364.1 hypothetical protein [Salmonella enterica]